MTQPWRPAGDGAIRVGLAGLGSMGRNHLRILAGRPDVTLAAVADPIDATLASASGDPLTESTRPSWSSDTRRPLSNAGMPR
jgi:hypothetical protein